MAQVTFNEMSSVATIDKVGVVVVVVMTMMMTIMMVIMVITNKIILSNQIPTQNRNTPILLSRTPGFSALFPLPTSSLSSPPI